MSQEAPVPANEPLPSSALPVQPVESAERIRSIDVLRGFALLGILPVNMIAFAHVEAAYQNPTIAGGYSGINYLVWMLTHLIFENKMVTIFSMLFGVGLFIQVDRAEQRRGRVGSARGLYFRRVGWLLLFGIVHAYLFWFGDILTFYAIMGMLIYWLRRLRPKTLIIVGTIFLLLGTVVLFGIGSFLDMTFAYVDAHPELVKENKDVQKMKEEFTPTQAKVEEEVKKVQVSGFLELAGYRAGRTLQFQLMGFLLFALWRFTGIMLIGIALFKLGAFTLQWSDERYRRWGMTGLGLGVPLMVIGIIVNDHQGGMPQMLRIAATYDYYGSLLMAAGYIGIILLVVKKQRVPRFTERLASVGQMALTNYLSHTLICTALFNGWGFGQFGTWQRYALLLLVLGIWTFQLIISPIWLRHFYFGPCEWVWRTLTYLKMQPLRRTKHDR